MQLKKSINICSLSERVKIQYSWWMLNNFYCVPDEKYMFILFIFHVYEFWIRTPPPHTHKITVNAAFTNLSFNAKHMSIVTCPFAIEFFDVKQNNCFLMLKLTFIYFYYFSQDTQGSYIATDIPYQWCSLRIYPSDLAKIQN